MRRIKYRKKENEKERKNEEQIHFAGFAYVSYFQCAEKSKKSKEIFTTSMKCMRLSS